MAAVTEARRKSSVIGSLRSNSLVMLDKKFGVEPEKTIRKRLESVHEGRAADLKDDVTSRRRASTLSIVNY